MKRTRATETALTSDAMSLLTKDQPVLTATPNLSPRKGRNLLSERPPWMETQEDQVDIPQVARSPKKDNRSSVEMENTKRDASPRKGRDIVNPNLFLEMGGEDSPAKAAPRSPRKGRDLVNPDHFGAMGEQDSSTETPVKAASSQHRVVDTKGAAVSPSLDSVLKSLPRSQSNETIPAFIKRTSRDNFDKLSNTNQHILFATLKTFISSTHEHPAYFQRLSPKVFQDIRERFTLYTTYLHMIEDRLSAVNTSEEKEKLQYIIRKLKVKLDCVDYRKNVFQRVESCWMAKRDIALETVDHRKGDDYGTWYEMYHLRGELLVDLECKVQLARAEADEYDKQVERAELFYEEMFEESRFSLQTMRNDEETKRDHILQGVLEALKWGGDGRV